MIPYAWRRVLLWFLAGLVAVQSLIISVLVFISEWRKRRAPPPAFPHERRQIAEVDGNDVRIYTYGQDLYNAMLSAIDNARETIYLETFIWKGDPLGETFKERLARKAAEGVQVVRIPVEDINAHFATVAAEIAWRLGCVTLSTR